MHRIAEHGVASHWEYKLNDKSASKKTIGSKALPTVRLLPSWDSSSSTSESSEAATQLRSINKNPATGSSYLDSLTLVREDMASQHSFVFVTVANSAADMNTEDCRSQEGIGKLVALPVNARVEDAVVEILQEYSANGFNPLSATSKKARMPTAKVFRNGRKARWSDTVETGDILLVSLQ